MSPEIFPILLVVALVAIYWLVRRTKRTGSLPLKHDSPPSTRDTPKPGIHSSENDFASELVSAKNRADRQVEIASRQHEREAEARTAEDLQLKKRLSEFARAQKLDTALVALYKEIEHYAAWSQREDFQKWNTLEISDISESSDTDTQSIDFSHGGDRFRLTCRQRRSWHSDDDGYSDLTLFENGIEVFAITCTVQHDEYATTYWPLSVVALKKQGIWAKRLIEFDAKIQIAQKKWAAERKYQEAEEIRKRFSD